MEAATAAELLMWNSNTLNNKQDDEDDSWEVRAFEEDTAGNQLLGCTWPPRSYACTFCRREFRSAQALGGHMNVHRRDRARLHRGAVPQQQPIISPEPPSAVTGRDQDWDFVAANGLCLLYPIPDHSTIFVPTRPVDFQSATLLPISPFSTNNNNHNPSDTAANSASEPSPFNSNNFVGNQDSSAMEELDLELRLGRRSP